ncbi:MAG: DUF2817 domain-containing protein [bacterium]|nr:DUF2817 domain-containing protein [bacterium]
MKVTKKIIEIKKNIQSIDLELFVVGSGNPKTFLMSGVHGNEKTGQIIIEKILASDLSFEGTLTMLPIANPTGFENNTREETTSNLDLNRNFCDRDGDELVDELITTILSLAKEHDRVIDLHSFKTAGLIQVVSNHVGDSDDVAMLFSPDVVRTSGKNRMLKATGSFCSYAKAAEIPYLLFELPLHNKTTSEQIDTMVSGFTQVLQSSGSSNKKLEELPHVGMRIIKAEHEGVFVKSNALKLGGVVPVGTLLGEIITGDTHYPVHSPFGGIICEMDPDEERSVGIRDTLVGVGELHS